jgi:hypothetical protein
LISSRSVRGTGRLSGPTGRSGEEVDEVAFIEPFERWGLGVLGSRPFVSTFLPRGAILVFFLFYLKMEE